MPAISENTESKVKPEEKEAILIALDPVEEVKNVESDIKQDPEESPMLAQIQKLECISPRATKTIDSVQELQKDQEVKLQTPLSTYEQTFKLEEVVKKVEVSDDDLLQPFNEDNIEEIP